MPCTPSLLQVTELCEPIVKLLRNADGNFPMTGKVHLAAYNIQRHLAAEHGLPAAVKRLVQRKWEDRWAYMDSPLHGAGYCLDPENLNDTGLGADEQDSCVQDLLTMASRLLAGDEDACDKARLSFAAYRAREVGFAFSTSAAARDSANTPAHQWWDMYGKRCPELQGIAMRVLSQPVSACSCERNWSTYDFIHNKRRNRLTPARARDLVYVFSNGRLAEKMLSGSAEEAFLEWADEQMDEATA